MPNTNFRIALITLGEELLLGLRQNEHLTYIGTQLRKRGAMLNSNLTISDEPSEIESQFKHAWENNDLIITTGGLGPTVDDRTKSSIASVLQEELVYDQESANRIEEIYRAKGRKVTENVLKQAYRLNTSQTIPNDFGTAPGLYLEKGGKRLIMLPGPPSELKPMFEFHVLALLESHSLVRESEDFLQIRTIGVPESKLESDLQAIFKRYDSLSVAYCAHNGHVDIRLSSEEHDGELILKVARECQEKLGLDFLCFGNDSLEKVVSNLLRRSGASLAVAEGCTGGMLSNAFTDIPGAAKFYLGGLTCYNNQAKMDLLHVPEDMIHQHSSISNETAIAMAAGVAELFEANYTLSTTGYSGPKGDINTKTQGTIYVGLHTNQGIWAKKLELSGTREVIKRRVTLEALDWLRRTLLETPEKNFEHEALREESKNILKSFS